LASVSYNHDGNFTASYENYAQSKANIAKNTTPSTSSFESACISITFGNQEMVLPVFYHTILSDFAEAYFDSMQK
jgi:hypothetical protein